MPLNESLKQYPARENSINYSNSNGDDGVHVTINTDTYDRTNLNQINQKKFEPFTIADGVIFITPIIFVLTTVAVVRHRLNKVKPVNLPCKNCKFYNNNNYVKCAVNPTEVLTEKAIDCRDYSSQNQKFSWFSWRGFSKRE